MFTPYSNTLILDQLRDVNFSAAYSLRKLTSKALKAIKVRRSSDNTLLDIGFVGTVLDTMSLLSFVGSGDGFVQTWYDQSINGNNAVQTTNGNQPRIVSGGVLDVDSGKPCIQAILANSTHLIVSNNKNLDFTSNASFSAVHNPAGYGESNGGRIFEKYYVHPYWQVGTNGTMKVDGVTSTSALNVFSLNQTNINTVTVTLFSNESKYYLNGALNNTSTFAGYTSNSQNLYIFNRSGLGRQYDGKMSELIIFKTTLTDIQRQKLERNQGKFYSINIA